MLNMVEKFGKSVKAVIGGMLLGLVLLPVGIWMQYISANQMQYHKEFDKSIVVQSSSDPAISGSDVKIKTEGKYTLSDGPFLVQTPLGDVFSGRYISYNLDKWVVAEEKKEKKDKDGNTIKDSYGNIIYDISYRWEKASQVASSPDGITVEVNGFVAYVSSFKQRYLPTASKYFEYFPYSSRGATERTGSLRTATKDDYDRGVYSIVLDGTIYDEKDETVSIAGMINSGSNELKPIIKKGVAAIQQSMLAITYGNLDDLRTKLESSAKGERLFKFIIGSLCFIFGFAGLFGPVIKIFDLIPFLGKLANGIIYFILIIVSIILSVIFYLFFQFFWILVAIAVVTPILMIVLKKKKTA